MNWWTCLTSSAGFDTVIKAWAVAIQGVNMEKYEIVLNDPLFVPRDLDGSELPPPWHIMIEDEVLEVDADPVTRQFIKYRRNGSVDHKWYPIRVEGEPRCKTFDRWAHQGTFKSLHSMIAEQIRKRNEILDYAVNRYVDRMPWWKRRFFREWWLRRELVIIRQHDGTETLKTTKGETLVEVIPPRPLNPFGGYNCRHQLTLKG